jgi:hypothetical protein
LPASVVAAPSRLGPPALFFFNYGDRGQAQRILRARCSPMENFCGESQTPAASTASCKDWWRIGTAQRTLKTPRAPKFRDSPRK